VFLPKLSAAISRMMKNEQLEEAPSFVQKIT